MSSFKLIPTRGRGRMPPFRVARQFGSLRRRARRNALTSDDLPTPDCPTNNVTQPASRCSSSAIPCPVWQLTSTHSGAICGILDLRQLDRFRRSLLLTMSRRVQFLEHGSRPVAVHQEPVRRRLRRHDDGQSVDVGGHRLGAAARIDSFDEIAARLDRLDGRAIGGRWIRPRSPDRRTPRAICGPSVRSAETPPPVCTNTPRP